MNLERYRPKQTQHAGTIVNVIDGCDGHTPDMLRQKPNKRTARKWMFNPAAFDDKTVVEFIRMGMRPATPDKMPT